jgi:MFS transporter, DHA1 family, tetracycline resistance protein
MSTGAARPASLGFIWVTLFLDVLGIGLVIPVLPRLLGQLLNTDEVGTAPVYGWLAATYAVVQFLCSPLIGSASDRWGRRPVLLASNLGMGLDYLLLTWAPTMEWVFVGRLISGLTGASIGTATAYIADISPPDKRAQNFGLVGVAFGLGFIAGPTLGGLLGQVSLRLPFVAAAVLCLGNFLWGFFVLPESLPSTRRRPFSWARANPIGTLGTLLGRPLVGRLVVALLFTYLAQRMLESTWVLYTGHRYGWGPREAGLSLGLVGLASVLVQGVVARRFIPWAGERGTLLFSMSIAALCHLAYGLAPLGWVVLCVLPIGGLGGMAVQTSQAIMSREMPPDQQGLLQGGLASLQSISAIVGPPLGTQLLGHFSSAAAPVYLPGMSYFAGACLIAVGLTLATAAFRANPPKPSPVAV